MMRIAIFFQSCISVYTLAAQLTPLPSYGFTSEGVIRARAITAPKPSYPLDALRSGTSGVVVAAISLTANGTNVSRVEIVEAPSPLLGAAVDKAIRSWHFAAWEDNSTKVSAKLTFYFVIKGRRGSVFNPSEMPLFGKLN